MRLSISTLFVLALAALAPAMAAACPICPSSTGQQVRAALFGPSFGANLLVALLPFAVSLAAAAVIRSAADRAAGGAPHPAVTQGDRHDDEV
jgi:hypothetical protein